MTTEDTAAKKDMHKLQRAIVDGLEDVKGHDIQVFNTEHLSPLFERVIVASGTSNRQTKALAASVRDAVREAGFPKPRIEGEENGEWIIVDCGAAVAHIMQPTFRQYYRLEDLWGDKPVRIRFGAPKPVEPVRPAAKKSGKAGTAAKAGTGSTATGAPTAKKAAAKKVAAKTVAAKEVAAKKSAPKAVPVKKTSAAGKTAVKKAANTAVKKTTSRTATTAAAKWPRRASSASAKDRR